MNLVFFRLNNSLKVIDGECKSVTDEMTSSWNETTLPDCKLRGIFNGDKFGFFDQFLPNRTYHLKGEKSSGGTKSKIRVTGMAAASGQEKSYPCLL